MIWMTSGESRFVEDDAIVVRAALDSDQKEEALVALLRQLALAQRIAIWSDELPVGSRRDLLHELNELTMWLLDNYAVALGMSDAPFPGIGSELLDEALRTRESAVAMNQIREVVRFAAHDLRRHAWSAGMRARCPRCDTGWVVYATVLDRDAAAVAVEVCRQCEATWLPGDALLPERALELSAVLKGREPRWELLEVHDGTDPAGTD